MRPEDDYDRCARYGHPTDDDGVCDCGAVGPLIRTADDLPPPEPPQGSP